MKRHTLEVHAESTASPEELWRLLADVTTWPDWTRFDEASYEREGTPPPHGLGAVRAFRVGRLRSKDTVVAYDPPSRLSYTYEGWLPIKDYRADVTLEGQGDPTASPEEVWRLLADVTTWPDWTRFDEASYEREGMPPPHGLGAVRAFRVGRLRSKDTVVAHDPPRRLSYTYEGWLPIKDYRADVTLEGQGDRTRITWRAEFAGTFPLAGALTRRLLNNVLQELASRLGGAAETARTSPQAGEG